MSKVSKFFGAWPACARSSPGRCTTRRRTPTLWSSARAYGAFLVLEDRFDPEEFLGLIERHQITSMYMVPTMFMRLLRLPPEVRDRYDVSSLRHISHTAAPCPPDVKRAMIEWWGPIVERVLRQHRGRLHHRVHQRGVARPSGHRWSSAARPATCGSSATTDQCRSGSPARCSFARAANSDFTYFGKDEARAEVERDGLITCGDIGFLDADGFLYLCDRARDMIISGGVNIYPIEIEACLLKLDGVADCAVFGIPDDEYGESIAAAIKLDEGASLERGRYSLARASAPRRVQGPQGRHVPRVVAARGLRKDVQAQIASAVLGKRWSLHLNGLDVQ